ncbi:MAG: SDR family oxidoreductase [Thermoleophilaceae bacterium]|nr:SDR family oxidoreductase [Thermoleophilaceae bacterium]
MSAEPFLAGRTCVITGAGSGMGRAVAVRMSRMGCPVAICDWDEEGLQVTAELVAGPVLSRKFDVSDRLASMAFASDVKEWAPSKLGMILNNAGVTVSQLASEAASEDDEWVMNVNFWGVVNGTRAYMPLLLEQGDGAIVNTSSIFGLMGWPAQSMYCASKHAVRGYTESLRHELRDTDIRVCLVHPGGVKTNIVRNARFHKDDLGRTDRAELEKEFDSITITTPERAAKIIQQGVDKNNPRILVGPDAIGTSILNRLAPVRYFDFIKMNEKRLRR